MFFEMQLDHDVLLHPMHFGPDLREVIQRKLHDDVESTCIGQHGFIVAVTDVVEISDGLILAGRGEVLFHVTYRAVLFRPIKGEVVDAVVKTVAKPGIFVDVGPLNVFISHGWIPKMSYVPSADPPCFRSDDETEQIQAEDNIRVRILGTRVNAADITATASLEGDYLGAQT